MINYMHACIRAVRVMMFFSAFIGFLFLFFSYFSNNRTGEVLVIGMLAADPPFMSINELNEFEGFDVDVARLIAQQLNRILNIKEMGMTELFIALENGSIDMIMCGLSITDDRLQRFAMVHYQGGVIETFPLVFWNEIPRNISTMSDFNANAVVIGVLPGTIQEQFLIRNYPSIQRKIFNSYTDIIMELKFGKITGALFDEAIASYVQMMPELKVLNVSVENFVVYGNGIAIKKENQMLAEQVQQSMQVLKDNGDIIRLEKQWMR